MCLLDASALLAYLLKEPGHEIVATVLTEPVGMSAVNLAEVLFKLERYVSPSRPLADLIEQAGLEIVPYGPLQLKATNFLRFPAHVPLSLADKVCLGTAAFLHCPVLTADRLWANLRIDVEVRLIR